MTSRNTPLRQSYACALALGTILLVTSCAAPAPSTPTQPPRVPTGAPPTPGPVTTAPPTAAASTGPPACRLGVVLADVQRSLASTVGAGSGGVSVRLDGGYLVQRFAGLAGGWGGKDILASQVDCMRRVDADAKTRFPAGTAVQAERGDGDDYYAWLPDGRLLNRE